MDPSETMTHSAQNRHKNVAHKHPLSHLTFKRSRGLRRPCINLDFITGNLSRQPEGSRSNLEQRERSWLPEKGCSLSEHLPRLKTCEPSLAVRRDLARLPKALNLYKIRNQEEYLSNFPTNLWVFGHICL